MNTVKMLPRSFAIGRVWRQCGLAGVSVDGRVAAASRWSSATPATASQSPLAEVPPASMAPMADIAAAPQMRSSALRKLAQAAAAEGGNPMVWQAIADRCQANAEQLNYWDIVLILQAFTAAGLENRSLLMRLAEVIGAKTSKLAPKHLLDIFAVYEAHGLRPRALYVELFHAIVRLSRSMHAEEISISLQCLARHRLGNPTAVAHLVQSALSQLRDFRLRYLCGATGALGVLEACPESLMERLDAQAKFAVETVPLQELLADLQAFPGLEFSWRPYEDLCLEELLSRSEALESAEDMDQFVDPFEAMRFMQSLGKLSDGFLGSLCRWCVQGVHRPNVRSERRPTAAQLVELHDACRERGLETSPALQDAIRYYVESGAGQWPRQAAKPLKYRKHRSYISTPDPLEGMVEMPVSPSQPAVARAQPLRDLPGLPPSEPAPAEPQELIVTAGRRKKPSARAAGLSPEESTVHCWITSRKGPRREGGWRHRRDPGMKKMLRKDMPRAPLWYQGGWHMRPKYQQGVATKNYPWAGVPTGHNGTAYIMRK